MKRINLYKFREINDYSKTNILNQSIWLSNAEKLNDPFDSARYLIENYSKFVKPGMLDSDKIDKKEKLLKASMSKCGICSFSSGFDNEKLWSHYADSHKGICIEYTFELENSNIFDGNIENYSHWIELLANTDLFPILYLNANSYSDISDEKYEFSVKDILEGKNIERNKKAFEGVMQKYIKERDEYEGNIFAMLYAFNPDLVNDIMKFFSSIKREYWNEENEIRFCKFFDSDIKDGIEYKEGKITGIILGLDFMKNKPEKVEILREILRYSEKAEIPVYKLTYEILEKFKFQYKKEEIKSKEIMEILNKNIS